MIGYTEDVTTKRTQLIDAARAMLGGELGLIEGCRTISSLGRVINPTAAEKEILSSFMMVDSETLHFPLHDVRNRYCPTFLAELDQEKEEYLGSIRRDFRVECSRLIETLTP